MQPVLKKVLERIRPRKPEFEENDRVAKMIIGRLKDEGYEAELVGSRARGTFVSGDRDLDIFFFFPPSAPRNELEKQGLAVGKKVLRDFGAETHYAEHPYVRGMVGKMRVEVVPCYRIKDKIISAVDRSPLHNRFLKKQMKAKQRDDVILLKQFMKAAGTYGADQKTHGFSGYLCELLVLKYGSFEKVIKGAAKWKPGTTIDILKLRSDYSKFAAPLVVIDPVDAERNVAAALNAAGFERFIGAAKRFLKSPSEEFFFPKQKAIDAEGWTKGKNIVLITMTCPEVVEEILWSQLERLASSLERQLRLFDFDVVARRHWTDEKKACAILLELKSLKLTDDKEQMGPLVKDASNYEAFVQKHKEHWVSGGRVHARVKRRYTDASKLIKDTLSSGAVPSHLRPHAKKALVLVNQETLKEKGLLELILGGK